MDATQGPSLTPEQREQRRIDLVSRCRVDLWKAVWEASQVMTYTEIRELVESTIREIDADAP